MISYENQPGLRHRVTLGYSAIWNTRSSAKIFHHNANLAKILSAVASVLLLRKLSATVPCARGTWRGKKVSGQTNNTALLVL